MEKILKVLFILLNNLHTNYYLFLTNRKYDVMAILVFGFSSFYQYWLLILLQYQSPWANKTHTFNLLLLRKGGWLVAAALKKSTERRLVWKDAIFYWCQFSSSWWNELVKKRKVGSPTYFLLFWFFSLGRRIVGV